jgi:hypothetical protein
VIDSAKDGALGYPLISRIFPLPLHARAAVAGI